MAPSLRRLFLIYARVSNLTFGGGDPTMAALQSELVASRGWLSPDKYALVYGLARITPGTNILAFCAGTAWYLMAAIVINDSYGKTVLPVGPIQK